MDAEKRALRRRHLTTYPGVINTDTDELVGRVVDITTDGMRLISREPLPSETELHLKLIPTGTTTGDGEITFDAKGVWSAPDINPDYIDTGFMITNLAERDAQSISLLIRRSSFRD